MHKTKVLKIILGSFFMIAHLPEKKIRNKKMRGFIKHLGLNSSVAYSWRS